MTDTPPPVVVGPSPPLDRRTSFLVVAGAYLVAGGAGAVVAGLIGAGSPLVTVLVADLVATGVIFGFSRGFNNTSMYDAYWSVVPPVIALYLFWVHQPGTDAARQVLVLGLVFAWAIRLTANWARGWSGLDHEDWRYVEMRTNGKPYWLQSFFGLHLFPTLQVYLGCLALYPALTVGTRPFGPMDLLAVIITGGAIIIEFVADEQLRAFNATKLPGDVCDVGLWRWSRHPNYFGELSFWWGLWLFGVSADPVWWWTAVGPLAMTAMFLFASIPMMDARSAQRRPAYEAYADRTSMLVPLPPKE